MKNSGVYEIDTFYNMNQSLGGGFLFFYLSCGEAGVGKEIIV